MNNEKTCAKCGAAKPLDEFLAKGNQCKTCKAEYNRKWRKANPEKAAENNRRWREANPEKKAEHARKWYQANREKAAENSRKWQKANPEKDAERKRKWREANREKEAEHNRKWREARRAQLSVDAATHFPRYGLPRTTVPTILESPPKPSVKLLVVRRVQVPFDDLHRATAAVNVDCRGFSRGCLSLGCRRGVKAI